MPSFLATLRQGGPTFTVEASPEGFAITAMPGFESAFSDLARLCLEKAGPEFVALPRCDGHGGYDQVQIIPVEPAED
ncbi:MAG: hypothetical protein EOO83_02795 [Oxalobacteraceae bacterium]|nr:MAG: hypothetical protein EOO83_02795 [Oxalobacteraceae bacterium]